MLALRACQTLVGGQWLFDCCVSYNGYNSYKHQRQALSISSLPPPHKYKPREGCEKSLYTSEIWDERTISNSKPLITLLLVEANTSEKVKPLHPLHQFTLNDFGNVLPFSII